MNKFFVCFVMVLSMASAPVWGEVSTPVGAEMVIIAHPEVPDTTLSPKAVQEIFLGKQVQWSDNSAIRVVAVKDPDLHAAFLTQYLKTSLSKWNTYWKRMVFTGQGMPPEQAESLEDLVDYVAETRGAIGYTDREITPIEDPVTLITVK